MNNRMRSYMPSARKEKREKKREERIHSLPGLVFGGKLVTKRLGNHGQFAGWCGRA